eukprot:TRINITY_DN60620_c0_g1_i1.p1 TRINITY_DN60620_c0_g1~~TRINITY_DN60620_c0_g1_i1.p1  ORF type:complete len:379 (+),score=67.23 TRINITY_DN60620_c0_g1_i1:28-1164(+)
MWQILWGEVWEQSLAGVQHAQGLLQPFAVLMLCALIGYYCAARKSPQKSEHPADPGWVEAEAAVMQGKDLGPNFKFTFIPSTGVLDGNPLFPYSFENENCIGKVLPLHRPTLDPSLESSGDYPYAAHFRGRKRLWELRWSFKFKHDVTDRMRFGIELQEYVPVNVATKRLMEMIVGVLRQTVGSEVYHSPGDDPSRVSGALERPVFTMPLFAFDQLIVTPEGEEPPDLTDPSFSELGMKRTDDLAAFTKRLSEMELKAGPVYTVAFWSISQFLDSIKWQIQKIVPFRPVDFNTLCGAPPVNLVLYTINDDARGDKRHLQTKKNYYFRLAFWSSLHPPSAKRLRELVPDLGTQRRRAASKEEGSASPLEHFFSCCSLRG